MTNLSLRLFKAYVFEQIELTKADWTYLTNAVAWRGLAVACLTDLPEGYRERRQWFRELHEEDPTTASPSSAEASSRPRGMRGRTPTSMNGWSVPESSPRTEEIEPPRSR